MGEYQSYELIAIDRPLTSKQMAELRAVSTRAEISPTRFWNEYQYGDLKADPAKLMVRHFDAHLYSANWGSRRLMLRVPLARVDVSALRACFVRDAVTARRVGQYLTSISMPRRETWTNTRTVKLRSLRWLRFAPS